MSWVQESKRTWLEKFCIDVLKCGPIPKHVAFIMDGNRRYATKISVEKLQGHSMGFEKFAETLNWCLDLGISEVTIYAFSIENFKRSEEEVNGLMNLIREKVQEMWQKKEKLDKYGVCVRIFGDITLLPVDLQMSIAELVLYTYNNTQTHLNICMAYTSREEISCAAKEIALEVVESNLNECDITEKLLGRSLYSSKSVDPDIVLRTSGEVRLSDFLLWQCNYSALSFFKVLWPEFKIWHLFLAVLDYQHNCSSLKKIKDIHSTVLQLKEEEEETEFAIREYQKTKNLSEGLKSIPSSEIRRIRDQMEMRRKNFLNHLDSVRYQRLVQIKDGNTVQNQPPVD